MYVEVMYIVQILVHVKAGRGVCRSGYFGKMVVGKMVSIRSCLTSDGRSRCY